jgi:hypothetical protein
MMFWVLESYAIEKSRCPVESLLSDNYSDPMKLKGGTWFEPLLSMAVSNSYYLNSIITWSVCKCKRNWKQRPALPCPCPLPLLVRQTDRLPLPLPCPSRPFQCPALPLPPRPALAALAGPCPCPCLSDRLPLPLPCPGRPALPCPCPVSLNIQTPHFLRPETKRYGFFLGYGFQDLDRQTL